MRKALITGITGQDGSYLAEFLLNKGYVVHGIKRRTSTINTERINHIYNNPNFHLHYGDLTDSANIISLVSKIRPYEIYNLAAMSHVKVSFEMPEYVANVDGLGALRLLEAIRIIDPSIRFYQASTSELYGGIGNQKQNEQTPFYPKSPYAVAKLFAHYITINYREAYNLFAVNGILFNHESPRRGETFITRKITLGIAEWERSQKPIYVGNINAVRDWGHAEDYVRGMWLMLQQDKPKDYVLATGQTASVKEWIDLCFDLLGYKLEWKGHDAYIDNKKVIVSDPKYTRPTEVNYLCGDYSKAQKELGWEPKHDLRSLASSMLKNDLWGHYNG